MGRIPEEGPKIPCPIANKGVPFTIGFILDLNRRDKSALEGHLSSAAA